MTLSTWLFTIRRFLLILNMVFKVKFFWVEVEKKLIHNLRRVLSVDARKPKLCQYLELRVPVGPNTNKVIRELVKLPTSRTLPEFYKRTTKAGDCVSVLVGKADRDTLAVLTKWKERRFCSWGTVYLFSIPPLSNAELLLFSKLRTLNWKRKFEETFILVPDVWHGICQKAVSVSDSDFFFLFDATGNEVVLPNTIVPRSSHFVFDSLGLCFLSGNDERHKLTGFSVFTRREPCLFCAMALVHARVKRLFYLQPSTNGAIETAWHIHHTLFNGNCLNHKIEAFRLFL